MADRPYHEPFQDLSPEAGDMHRALATLIEELEAVDGYAQRIDATSDEAPAGGLAHNSDEEKEHACMTLEWIRRGDPELDGHLRRYLSSSGSIAEVEQGEGAPSAGAAVETNRTSAALGVGSLRETGAEEAAS